MHWLITALLTMAGVIAVYFTARGAGKKSAEFEALNDAIKLARRKNSEAKAIRKQVRRDYDLRGVSDDYKYLRK